MAAVVLVSLLIAAVLLYFEPRLARAPKPGAVLPLEPLEFPPGFLWATGEDAYQHEGGNLNADWSEWELGSPFEDGSVAGDCADFWRRYEEDFARAAADGQNAHRIGLEWSRLEPESGRYDEAAWTRYRAMLESLKAKGLVTFVNLWHFTLPRWAAASGGWLDDQVFERWEAFAAEAARRLGDLVDYWSTMIDAQIYVLRGYFVGDIPPLKKDPELGLRVYARLLDAHAAASRAIKRSGRAPRGISPRVGQIYFFALFESAGNPLDSLACGQMDSIFNRAMLDALVTGTLELSLLGGPRIRRAEEDWKGSLDWLGVNYYYREIVAFSPRAQGFVRRYPGPSAGRTDLGWEIYPEGLYRLCVDLAGRYPGLPLMIAENGLADEADTSRPRFILGHLLYLRKLLDEGIGILGYTYWSLTDNLEWTQGFRPKFGLYRVDRSTMERSETRSARLFRFIATRNRLPSEEELASLD
jgi:beta-glucosidase